MCQQSMKFVEIQEENRLQSCVCVWVWMFFLICFFFILFGIFSNTVWFQLAKWFFRLLFRYSHSRLLPQESQWNFSLALHEGKPSMQNVLGWIKCERKIARNKMKRKKQQHQQQLNWERWEKKTQYMENFLLAYTKNYMKSKNIIVCVNCVFLLWLIWFLLFTKLTRHLAQTHSIAEHAIKLKAIFICLW